MGELTPPKEMFLPCAEPLARRGDESEPSGEGERMDGLRVEEPERGSAGRPYAGQLLGGLPDKGVSKFWEGAAGAGGRGELA